MTPRPTDAELVALSDGAALATRRRPGRPGTPDVVLLHGGPGLWDYLEPLADLIGEEASTYRYDSAAAGRPLLRRCSRSTAASPTWRSCAGTGGWSGWC